MTAVRRPRRVQASAGGAPRGLLLLVALLEEIDADLIAIDPGQFAAAIGQSGGRQQQEEFLQMQPLDRAFHRELCAGLGNVFHDAVAAPGAVDAHHVRGDAAFERDALALAPFCSPWSRSRSQTRPRRTLAGGSARRLRRRMANKR